jgi:hypothetical protein
MPSEFERSYRAFLASYAPTDADPALGEFVDRLGQLLHMAAVTPRVPAFVEPTVEEMRLRNAGWIARVKAEEEMGHTIPWPVV